MQLILNKAAYVWAEHLISSKRFRHEFFDWTAFVDNQNFQKKMFDQEGKEFYSLWYLALDLDKNEEDYLRYHLPLGDYDFMYSSALKGISNYAFKNHLGEIQNATNILLKKANIE